MAAEFCTIVSGSSGNCTYIGTDHTKILVDAGVSGKQIEAGLAKIQLTGADIDAIFITHEHLDHIKGAGIFSRRFNIPIYATCDTWVAMEEGLGKIAHSNKRCVYPQEHYLFNDLVIHPFSIPHDAADPVGYNVLVEKKKITVATDIGHVTDRLRGDLIDSDILLLEANHDRDMLNAGRYPWPLKKRILGDYGHLANDVAGELLASVVTGKMKYAFLGHLSEENNSPRLAFKTVEQILEKNKIEVGRHIQMDMAYRYSHGAKLRLD